MKLDDFVSQKRGVFVEYQNGEFAIDRAPDGQLAGPCEARNRKTGEVSLLYLSEDGASVEIPAGQWRRYFYWFDSGLMERDYLGFTRCADVKLLSYIALSGKQQYPITTVAEEDV